MSSRINAPWLQHPPDVPYEAVGSPLCVRHGLDVSVGRCALRARLDWNWIAVHCARPGGGIGVGSRRPGLPSTLASAPDFVPRYSRGKTFLLSKDLEAYFG